MHDPEVESLAPKLRKGARQEGTLNRRNIGILATVLGSAMAAWYWTRRRSAGMVHVMPARERGTLIYDNTPVASGEGII